MLSGTFATFVGVAGLCAMFYGFYWWNENEDIALRREVRKVRKQLRKE